MSFFKFKQVTVLDFCNFLFYTPRGYSYVSWALGFSILFLALGFFSFVPTISSNWVTFGSFVPLFSCLIIFLFPESYASRIALFSAICSFYWYAIPMFRLWFYLSSENPSSSYVQTEFVTHEIFGWLSSLGIAYHAAADMVSLYFVVLTNFVVMVCILASWNSPFFRRKEYFSLFLLMNFFLIHVFTQQNIFLFFLFFESVLIPMFLVIGIWGSRVQRVGASYRFFLYTLVGSSFFLAALCYIYFSRGTLDLFDLYVLLSDFPFSRFEQGVLWILIFLGFAVKIPLVPFHTWLPEAHVEAPTAGSMLLAGILLKMGGYGVYRFLLPLTPQANSDFFPLAATFCILSVLYASGSAIVHLDMKKIVAYSSVAHMGYSMVGIFSATQLGVIGGIMGMISHGFISTGLFFSVGVLYERYGTRVLTHYNTLARFHPVFCFFFFILILSNTGFPGTSSFIPELLVLVSAVDLNLFVAFTISFSVILSAVYSFWLFNRLAFTQDKRNTAGGGGVSEKEIFSDLNRREFFIMFLLCFVSIFLLGIFPSGFLLGLEHPVSSVVDYVSLRVRLFLFSFSANSVLLEW